LACTGDFGWAISANSFLELTASALGFTQPQPNRACMLYVQLDRERARGIRMGLED
jgi:hypothetical protein